MKYILMSFFLCLAALAHSQETGHKQDSVYVFEATTVVLSSKGERRGMDLMDPHTITLDIAGGKMTINSTSPEVKALMKDKMERPIQEVMGELSNTFSLRLDDHTMVHVYIDNNMVILTRDDIHPLDWGIQYMNAQMVN